jgi:hypothetical protein
MSTWILLSIWLAGIAAACVLYVRSQRAVRAGDHALAGRGDRCRRAQDRGGRAQEAAVKATQRGFAIYGVYKDSRGRRVRIQQSSTAAGPHVWIFCTDKNGEDATMVTDQYGVAHPMALSPHLTPVQATRVAKALLAFAEKARKS